MNGHRWLPAAGPAGTGSLLAAIMIALSPALGPLSAHMSTHIALMNVLAPSLALALVLRNRQTGAGGWSLAASTAIQIAVLWAVHAPPIFGLGLPALHLLLQALLFVTALGFWWTVLAQPPERTWCSLFTLLVTGKLFCLLGALLVFSPRALYPAVHAHAGHAGTAVMEDQQLAGMLMLVACPLSYVLAGIVIAARWLRWLDKSDAALRRGQQG
jgi:putative membrane protein